MTKQGDKNQDRSEAERAEKLGGFLAQLAMDMALGIMDLVTLTTDDLWEENGTGSEYPEWVRRSAKKISATVFHGPSTALAETELTPYRLGYVRGMLEFLEDALPKRLEKLEKASVQLKALLSPECVQVITDRIEPILGPLDTESPELNEVLEKLGFETERINELPVHDRAEFHRGYSDGLGGFGNGSSADRSNDATPILLMMVLFWRTVVRFNSRKELHQFLTVTLGAPLVGPPERLELICRRNGGPKFKNLGRPRKTPVRRSGG